MAFPMLSKLQKGHNFYLIHDKWPGDRLFPVTKRCFLEEQKLHLSMGLRANIYNAVMDYISLVNR